MNTNMTDLVTQLTETGRIDGLEGKVAAALAKLAKSAGFTSARQLVDRDTMTVSVAIGVPVKPVVRSNRLVEWDGKIVGQVRRRLSGQWGFSQDTDPKSLLKDHLPTRAEAVRVLTRSQGLF